jgi:hypothetical protein
MRIPLHATLIVLILPAAFPAPATAGDSAAHACPHAATPIDPTLGIQHRQLAALAGCWTVRQTMWTQPGAPPAIDDGTATITPVLGGRHLRQDLRIDAAGKPFQGLGYLGYDDAGQRYDSTWMDVNFTGMILAHGDYDASTHRYTFRGEMADPGHAGATSPLREVLQVQDADHFTYEYYERHEGAEMLAVRLEYERAH